MKKTKQKYSKKYFILYVFVSCLAFIISGYLIFQSIVNEPTSSYYGSKECPVYDQNGELAAYANVTVITDESFPKSNFPLNITLQIDGLFVPTGNWTYAVLEGATAAFPDREPSDWDYEVDYVIVLNSKDYSLIGSRIMNYTFGQDWDILLHVTRNTFYITHNIPPNPTNLPLKVYTIPNAIHLISDEYVIQKLQQQQSRTFDLQTKGALGIVTGLGFLIAAYTEKRT